MRVDGVSPQDISNTAQVQVWMVQVASAQVPPDTTAQRRLMSYAFQPDEVHIALLKQREDDKCSICLEEYAVCGCAIAILPCGHASHAKCLEGWLARSSACPICRESVPHSDDPDIDALMREVSALKHAFQRDADEAETARNPVAAAAKARAKAKAEAEMRAKVAAAKLRAKMGAAAKAEVAAAAQRELDEVKRVETLVANSKSVSALGLARSRIGAVAGIALAKLVGTSTALETLDLASNMLGQRNDVACIAIANAIKQQPPRLRTLSLRANYISDVGALAIAAALAHNAVLQELDLSGNEISDEAWAELGALLRHVQPSLRVVRLKCVGGGEAAVAMQNELKTIVPTLTVEL